MSGGEYAALAYGVVFVVVAAYVAIIAAKLQRLQRDTAALLESVRRPEASGAARSVAYAERVPARARAEEDPT